MTVLETVKLGLESGYYSSRPRASASTVAPLTPARDDEQSSHVTPPSLLQLVSCGHVVGAASDDRLRARERDVAGVLRRRTFWQVVERRPPANAALLR